MRKPVLTMCAIFVVSASTAVLAQSPKGALNGPSCFGAIAGTDIVRRVVKTGDIVIIPAGVPHGWTDISDHVDYLSVRPDPDRLIAAGYVNPVIGK